MAFGFSFSRKNCREEWNLESEDDSPLWHTSQPLNQGQPCCDGNLSNEFTITDSDSDVEFFQAEKNFMSTMLSRVRMRSEVPPFFNFINLIVTELIISITIVDYVMLFLSLFLPMPTMKHTAVPYMTFLLFGVKFGIVTFSCKEDGRKQLTRLRTTLSFFNRLFTFSALMLLYPIAIAGHITPVLEIISCFLLTLMFEINSNLFLSEFKLYEQVGYHIFVCCTTMKALWDNPETGAIHPVYTTMLGLVMLLLATSISIGNYILYMHQLN